MTKQQINDLKEKLRKEIKSEIGRAGWKAGISKKSHKWRVENAKKANKARWGKAVDKSVTHG